MAHSHAPATENVVRNFTLTAFVSFSIVFCLFSMMSTVKGSFKPPVSHHSSASTHSNGDAKHDSKHTTTEEHKGH